VPESDSDRDNEATTKATKPVVRRRRANTTNSDGILSLDENGRHRPTYKTVRASQKSSPYQLNRVNSMNSMAKISRSPERLSSEPESTRGETHCKGYATEPRRVKSEATSPRLGTSASLGHLHSQLPPLDLSAIEYPAYVANYEMFSAVSDQDQGLFSAGLTATSVDWSHYDLDFNASKTGDNFAPSSYSQGQSYGGFEFNGSEQAPTLTTTTSGEVSEVEDFAGAGPVEDLDAATFSGTSVTSNAFSLTAQSNMLSRAEFGTIDFDGAKYLKAGNKFLPTPSSFAGEDSALPTGTSVGSNSFSFLEDETLLWSNDYAHGLPTFTDSPDPNTLTFWDGQ